MSIITLMQEKESKSGILRGCGGCRFPVPLLHLLRDSFLLLYSNQNVYIGKEAMTTRPTKTS